MTTPIRETIARAIYQSGHGTMTDAEWADVWATFPDNFAPRTDAVLRALDEAGLVVVPKEAVGAMIDACADGGSK